MLYIYTHTHLSCSVSLSLYLCVSSASRGPGRTTLWHGATTLPMGRISFCAMDQDSPLCMRFICSCTLFRVRSLHKYRSLRTDLVDKSIKYYWCRTRVKGLKRLRQTQLAEETAEAEGTGPMTLSGLDVDACTPSNMGLRSAADIEPMKTEALQGEYGNLGIGMC